jgi:valyl-tRNA synthetase
MAFLAAQGQDVLFDKEAMKLGSRFANKIWNASRYLLMNLEGRTLLDAGAVRRTDIDRWLGHRLNAAAAVARAALEGYRFNEAAQAVYEFIWSDFCDWYIEAAKLSLNSDDAEKDRIVTLLLSFLEESLRLAHPFLPLITEEIYQTLPAALGGAEPVSIMTRPYPVADPARDDPDAQARFASLQELVRAVRTLRAEFAVPPDRRIDVTVVTEPGAATRSIFEGSAALIAHLAGTRNLLFQDHRPAAQGALSAAGRGFEAFVFIREAIDLEKESARLAREKEKADGDIRRIRDKLSNASFVERAPKEVVDREREKLEELARVIEKIDGYLRMLGN